MSNLLNWKKRLYLGPDHKPYPVSMHLFLYMTLIFGIAFVIPPAILGTGLTALFQFSASHDLAILWGMSCIVLTALNTIMLITYNKFLAGFVGILGFCLWTYAAIAYMFVGFPFGLLTIAIPNIVFWANYSFSLTKYKKYLYDDDDS